MEYRQVSRKDSAMRDRTVCVEMNTATAEATSVPATAMAKRTSRRAGVAVFALLALIVSAVLCASSVGMTLKAYADDASSAIGIVRVDGKDYYASSFKNLREELAKQKGKQVTVEMRCDWDARGDHSTDLLNKAKPDARLVIPTGAKVTLNMNGCMINRGLTSISSDSGVPSGEVIMLETGATLVVNGARAQSYSGWAPENIPKESRTVDVYNSANKDSMGSNTETFHGGVIAGGNSKDGPGGVRMQAGSTLHLNDVTIAGCRNNAGNNVQGCGGGVRMDSGETTLNMTRSTIVGCLASACGGGLYTGNTTKATINLEKSHIDKNYAWNDGGGFNPGGQNVTLTGDGESTISNNQSMLHGGGIYVWEGNVQISNITVKGNRSKDGGGVYTRQDSVVLSNLVVENNTATSYGGGLYIGQDAAGNAKVYKDSTVIRGCTVQNNSAFRYGGVFFDDSSNRKDALARKVSGKTVIKNNSSGDQSIFKNLCIKANGWNAKRECFDVEEGSEVWVSFEQVADTFKVDKVFEDKKCEKYLHSDKAGYGFKYGVETHSIVLLADGESIPSGEEVGAVSINDASHKDNSKGNLNAAGKIGTVGEGGSGSGSDYDLIRGFHMHDNESDLAAFYYSDGLFYGDKRHSYNEHLATLSWSMAFSGGYLNDNKPADANGNTYYNKHAAARQFLADIGCSDQAIYVNDSMVSKPGTDSIGVTIGSKKLMKNGKETGDVLVPVIVRGIGYDDEWMNNVLLGTVQEMSPGMEAKGFSGAADQVTKEIKTYLTKNGLNDEYRAGKMKFWVVGYSRAGATANLTSKRLVDMIAEDKCKSEVFGYTCEAAKGGTDTAEKAGNDYSCIHNMVNMVDLVPYVAPEQMGFKRYGVDHYLPGTAAGTVKKTSKSVDRQGAGGSATVTTYADNDIVFTKTAEYNKQKDIMLKQLKAMDSTWVFNDYFQPRALDFINLTHGTMYIYNNGDYDNNRVEDFVANFMWLLVEKSNISRDKYAKDSYQMNGKTYVTIETAARNAMKVFRGSEGSSGFTASAKNITNFIPKFKFGGISFSSGNNEPAFSMTSLYSNVIGRWGKLDGSKKATWTKNLWDALGKTGAIGKLSKDSQAKMEASFPTLLDLAFTVVDSDYNYKPKKNQNNQWAKGSSESMMYLPTFMKHSEYIVGCHAAALNIAWARSYDSWYTSRNDLNEYRLGKPSNVDAPKAFAVARDKKTSLDVGASKENKLTGDQRIVLDNDKVVGEAVYYDLYDVTNGGNVQLAKNQIYRGGIDLALGNAEGKSYQIVTYDISYGVTSEKATYRVVLGKGNHKVVVHDELAKGTSSSLAGASTGAGSGGRSASASDSSLMAGSIAGNLLAQDDNQDEGITPRKREFSFMEGQLAVVQANVPDVKHFKSWKVSVLNEDGTVAVDDVADTLLIRGGTSIKGNDDVSFTMPEVGNAYPANYQLSLTAVYDAKTTAVRAETAMPETGKALPSEITVKCDGVDKSCPVVWTYEDSDGETALAPNIAYGSTAYTATIFIEQDTQNGIVFADTVAATANVGTVVSAGIDSTAGTPVSSVKRNPSDGSITISVRFDETAAGDSVRPEHYVTVKAQAFDLNKSQRYPGVAVREYRVHPGTTVSLMAPSLENMLFVTWKLGSGLELAAGGGQTSQLTSKSIDVNVSESAEGSTIEAQYVPIAQKVEVNLRDAEGNLFQPSGDGEGPASVEAFIKLADEYEINPEDLVVEWSPGLPQDGVFAPFTDYTGTVRINPESADGKVRIRLKGSSNDWTPVEDSFAFADDFDAVFNGDRGDGEQSVAFDPVAFAVSKTFPKTKHILAVVEQPDDISEVPFGADEAAIRALLPSTTSVVTTGGFELTADISWNSVAVAEVFGDQYGERRWEASGNVTLPENVDADGTSLAVSTSIYVDEALYALAPSASLESGAYLYDQMVTLTTNEDGGVTYYTLDGSDPRTSETRREYQGESIYINREEATWDEQDFVEQEVDDEIVYELESTGRKAVILKAYTESPDPAMQQGSACSEYEYVFADIPMPEGAELAYDGNPQIGVEWSPFYDLAVEGNGAGGLTIDDEGNAVATNQGTYTVTATLGTMPNCQWEANDEGVRPEGPQRVTFTIASGSQPDPSTYAITLKANPAKGGTVSGGGTYRHGDVVTVNATPNAGYKFVGWTTVDDVTVSMSTAYTLEVGTADFELTANFVPVSAEVFTAKWVDEAGNELDERSYYHYDGVEDPTYNGEPPTKKADAQYTYRFSRWVGTTSGTVTTFRPEYKKTLNSYKVTFVNYDGRVLQSGNVNYGSLPAYKGVAPTKAATANYRYKFKGWTPALAKVTGQATYKAVFDKVKKASQVISAKKSVTKTIKVPAKVKKLRKTQTVNLKKLAKVSAKTTVVFRKANKVGGSKIAVAKSGKVTLKKGLKRGPYKLKVKLTAPTNDKYKAAKTKTITLKVVIRK